MPEDWEVKRLEEDGTTLVSGDFQTGRASLHIERASEDAPGEWVAYYEREIAGEEEPITRLLDENQETHIRNFRLPQSYFEERGEAEKAIDQYLDDGLTPTLDQYSLVHLPAGHTRN